MARSRETKIELTAYDDLFQTDESREEAKLSKIRDIPISEIDEFPDHPFKVLMDEDMEQLVESIKRNGVMTPATVRIKEDGRYELISGHRRKKACELAGLETVKLTPETYSTALTALLDSHSDSAYSQVEAYAVEEIRTQVKAVVAEQIRATITNNTDMMAQIDAGVETAYGTEIDTLAQN